MTTESQNPADVLAMALAEHLKQRTKVARAWPWILGAALLAVALAAGAVAIYNEGFAVGMSDGLRACWRIRES